MLLTTTLGNIALLFGSDGKASVYNAGDLGSSPGLGRSPGDLIKDFCDSYKLLSYLMLKY